MIKKDYTNKYEFYNEQEELYEPTLDRSDSNAHMDIRDEKVKIEQKSLLLFSAIPQEWIIKKTFNVRYADYDVMKYQSYLSNTYKPFILAFIRDNHNYLNNKISNNYENEYMQVLRNLAQERRNYILATDDYNNNVFHEIAGSLCPTERRIKMFRNITSNVSPEREKKLKILINEKNLHGKYPINYISDNPDNKQLKEEYINYGAIDRSNKSITNYFWLFFGLFSLKN